MEISERLAALRGQMRAHGLQAYIIPTDDYHGSEYVGDYFKTREFMSGFTGSAGTLVVTETEAALWTDGRYFLQAAAQLAGSAIRLMKMGEPGVEDIPEYLAAQLPVNARIGFDGRTMPIAFAENIREKTKKGHMILVSEHDLCGNIWSDRPALSAEPIWELEEAYAGRSRKDKLAGLRAEMEKKGADYLVLSALDEIAWLLNLRGNDIEYTPVFLAYMLVGKDTAKLCVQKRAMSPQICHRLEMDGVTVTDYEDIYEIVGAISPKAAVWIDKDTANYRLFLLAADRERLLTEESPVIGMKAVKNQREIQNMRKAHIKDGVAVTRFMHWLKTRAGKEEITEISAAAKLKEFRRQMGDYLEESFAPIIGYGEHGAIIHYEAEESSNAMIEPRGLCLADTGAQYLEGTTDITRTFALGGVTAEEKKMFTLVLKGHLQLGAARFKYGVCGQNLDYLARAPLWAEGLDYNHGTGHGVGCLLCVHEGPQRIQWRISRDSREVPFEEGMVVSNEPGLYLEGKFGIRHENLLLCKKGEKTEYGQFMQFENLTMVPFDKDGIEVSLLTEAELAILNAYHAEVFAAISPWFAGADREWLKEATSPLQR